jgi:hypothetical protein
MNGSKNPFKEGERGKPKGSFAARGKEEKRKKGR